jgi:hypothetical protein
VQQPHIHAKFDFKLVVFDTIANSNVLISRPTPLTLVALARRYEYRHCPAQCSGVGASAIRPRSFPHICNRFHETVLIFC